MDYRYSNSKYAKRKRRDEFRKKFDQLPKDEQDKINWWTFVILAIICFIIFLLTDLETLAKWVSH